MSEHSAPVIPIAASPHFAVAAMVRQHTPEVVHYDPQLTTARILDQHDPVRLVNVLVYALADAIVSPASTTQDGQTPRSTASPRSWPWTWRMT